MFRNRYGHLILRRISVALLLALSASLLRAADFGAYVRAAKLPLYDVEIIAELLHDTASFTQGLVFYDGFLYESTGQYGRSTVQRIDPATGAKLKTVPLDAGLFGEGLTVCSGELIQITWRENTALFYSLPDLEPLRKATYETEGWGLTTDGHLLLMTDGGNRLLLRHPEDFTLERTMPIKLGRWDLNLINELEFVQGRVWANLLGVDYLVEIDPATGEITAAADCRLLRARAGGDEINQPLNGIAYDPAAKEFFLTGKSWPALFRVRLVRSFGG